MKGQINSGRQDRINQNLITRLIGLIISICSSICLGKRNYLSEIDKTNCNCLLFSNAMMKCYLLFLVSCRQGMFICIKQGFFSLFIFVFVCPFEIGQNFSFLTGKSLCFGSSLHRTFYGGNLLVVKLFEVSSNQNLFALPLDCETICHIFSQQIDMAISLHCNSRHNQCSSICQCSSTKGRLSKLSTMRMWEKKFRILHQWVQLNALCR